MKTINKKLLFIFYIFFLQILVAETSPTSPSQEPMVPYRLFRTENFWVFIKLNTITGQMWLVQFDISGDHRGTLVLSLKDLAKDKDRILGRFTLYPTSNMYTFILLDQFEGNTWQVQWSADAENRFILPISE